MPTRGRLRPGRPVVRHSIAVPVLLGGEVQAGGTEGYVAPGAAVYEVATSAAAQEGVVPGPAVQPVGAVLLGVVAVAEEHVVALSGEHHDLAGASVDDVAAALGGGRPECYLSGFLPRARASRSRR